MISADDAIRDYLRRLEREAAALPGDRRQDLLHGISEHITAARAAGAAGDEAAVRTLLDRLGEPQDIVAAAREEDGTAGDRGPRRPGTVLELAAVLMLTAGSFLPVVGWLVGVVLLWTSGLWRAREKLLGTLVIPLGPFGVLLLGGLVPFESAEVCTSAPAPVGSSFPPPTSCTTSGPPEWLGAVVLAVLLVASIAVPVVLLRIARRRAELSEARTSGAR